MKLPDGRHRIAPKHESDVDFVMRPSMFPVVVLWVLAGALFALSATVAVREPSFWLPALACLGIGGIGTAWFLAFKVELTQDILRYSAPMRKSQTVALDDVFEARIISEFFSSKRPTKPAVHLLLQTRAPGISNLDVNLKVFRREDVGRLVKIFASRGVLQE